MNYSEMKLVNSPNTMKKYFGEDYWQRNIERLFDYNRLPFTDMDGDTWLKDATKATVIE